MGVLQFFPVTVTVLQCFGPILGFLQSKLDFYVQISNSALFSGFSFSLFFSRRSFPLAGSPMSGWLVPVWTAPLCMSGSLFMGTFCGS